MSIYLFSTLFRFCQAQNWKEGGAFQQYVSVISDIVSKVGLLPISIDSLTDNQLDSA